MVDVLLTVEEEEKNTKGIDRGSRKLEGEKIN